MDIADIANAANLVQLFLRRAGEQADQPFLTAKTGGQWTPITYREAARQVCRLAQALRERGLERGDRVVIVSENRPEWAIADLAIMAAGCITVPAYTTNTPADHRHILEDSGARAVFLSGERLAGPLLEAMARLDRAGTGRVEQLIAIEPLEAPHSGPARLSHWADLIGGGEGGAADTLSDPGSYPKTAADTARDAVEAELADTGRRDLACIIYTSGTSGRPRGVMLSHGAILANVHAAGRALARDLGWGEERFLSFLPLSHALEHTAGLMLPIGLGAEICYAEGLEKLSSNLAETRPTLMIVVPRLFEVLRARIVRQVEKEGALARFLLRRAVRLGERLLEGEPRLVDRPIEMLLDRTLRPKIAERFGGRVKALVSGGAPLNPDVGAFFQGLGMVMLQGYGQTEAAPVIACNFPSAGIRLRTVGPPLGDTELRIADDGEILVRGELVMEGYWNDPEASAETLRDGWLHTGDIGHLDSGGRLVITDRKKDIIVNDKGDNIAPQKLEGMLAFQPEIAQAMVAGDQRPYLVALLVPDADWAKGWAEDRVAENGAAGDLARLRDDPHFLAALRKAVDRTNADLSITEKIRKFALADEPFTIENGELTPTMKVRRHAIRERYGDRLDALA